MRPLHCVAFCVTRAFCDLLSVPFGEKNQWQIWPKQTQQWATPSNQNRNRITDKKWCWAMSHSINQPKQKENQTKKRNKPLYPSNQNRKRIRDRYGQRRLRNEPFYPAKATKQKLLVKITSTEKGKGCIFIMLSKCSPFKEIYSASNISQGLKKMIYKERCRMLASSLNIDNH